MAICPHPPLLVPTVAGAAAFETDDLRAACDLAVGRMLSASPRQVVIIGSDGGPLGLRAYAPGAPDLPDYDLALPLVIGSWLLDRADAWGAARRLVAVRADGSPVGSWPDFSEPTGLLVMADGSARRNVKSPGYLDERAEPFDTAVTTALASSDLVLLEGLDVGLAADLLVGGVGPLKALAGLATGTDWCAEVLYDAAPYGVQYTVAAWSRA
jgi:hypothetical protein